MPILVAPTPVEAPTVHDPRPTQVSWTSPAGRTTLLTNWQSFDSGIMVRPGVLGLLMPAYTFYEDTSPAFDGTSVRGVRAGPRDVTVPLYIWGPDRSTCLELFHDLIGDLNPQNGIGTLTITESGGTSRSIGAYYSQGFEGDDNDDTTGRHWMSAAVVFHAPRPYWEGDQQSVTFDVGSGAATFFPVLPVQVKNSQILGTVNATNIGNVLTYPVWTVTGPVTSLTITNNTTGQTFTVATTAIAGDTWVIDAREGVKSALKNGSTNLWQYIDINSDLWALKPGVNSVTITVPGAASQTTVTMAYKPRYLAAY